MSLLPKTLFVTQPCEDLFWCKQEETDVWGTLTVPNSVIFHDNDVRSPKSLAYVYIYRTIFSCELQLQFEVFVDTEGSNHNYKEVS